MKRLKLMILTMGSAAMLALGGCADECKDITCENGGTCEEGICNCAEDYYGSLCADKCVNGTYGSGTCDCEAGYEGESCEDESRMNWVGTFNVTDVCDSDTYTYESSITNGTEVNEINFSNFGGFQVTISGTIDNSTELTIAQQTDASNRVFSGTGSISSSNNTITVDYVVKFDDGSEDNCVATYTRK